jgi:hypothetical protein
MPRQLCDQLILRSSRKVQVVDAERSFAHEMAIHAGRRADLVFSHAWYVGALETFGALLCDFEHFGLAARIA